jgi:hypothetical protein
VSVTCCVFLPGQVSHWLFRFTSVQSSSRPCEPVRRLHSCSISALVHRFYRRSRFSFEFFTRLLFFISVRAQTLFYAGVFTSRLHSSVSRSSFLVGLDRAQDRLLLVLELVLPVSAGNILFLVCLGLGSVSFRSLIVFVHLFCFSGFGEHALEVEVDSVLGLSD